MADNQKIIYVYEDWSDANPILIGSLFVNNSHGSEIYSFEYDQQWLKNYSRANLFLDPELLLCEGRQFSLDQKLFGLFSDSCPDRWGRLLMKRREAIDAKKANRMPRKLLESDYLLGVSDKTRMGALRFKMHKDGRFLFDDSSAPVPSWTTLRTLEEAARGFEIGDDQNESKWVSQLISPGSSLGGARPKASVQDNDGNLWVAKFPSKNDDYDVGAWEKVASDLAKRCGLDVPETRETRFSKYGTTFLSKRFDRCGQRRIHFSSAMTLLGMKDGDSNPSGASYMDMVEFIRGYGAYPKKNITELWKRIVFNMAIHNTDDHLRNHGFILTKKGWELSPLYDVNPIPYGEELSLNVTYDSNHIDIETLLDFASLVDYDIDQAKKDVVDICMTVSRNWRSFATNIGIERSAIGMMEPAFSFADKWAVEKL